MSDESEGEESPAEAAQRAVQGQTEGSNPTPQTRQTRPQTPESAGNRGSSERSGLRDALRAAIDAEAEGPEVGSLQSDYDLGKPQALILRGVLRIAGCVRMPPVGDISLGALLWASDDDDRADEPETTESPETTDGAEESAEVELA